MSANIFFIADTHFGHENLVWGIRKQFSNIKDHDETIVQIWNATVKQKDIVWHLGDVAWTKEALQWVKMLHGHKRLIMGNHDHFPILDYVASGFEKIYGIYKKYDMVMSHIPIHVRSLEDRWCFNVHGHIHYKKDDIVDSRYYNVCCDHHHFLPVSLETIRLARNSR